MPSNIHKGTTIEDFLNEEGIPFDKYVDEMTEKHTFSDENGLLNPSRYMKYLDGMDMTEQQKIEYIETLGSLLKHFVDEAWKDRQSQSLSAA